MKIAGSFPALLGTVALLSVTCLPVDFAWSEPASATPTALQGLSRQDWNRALIRNGHASERLGQKQDALADYTLAIESHVLTGNDQVQVLFDRGLLLDGMGRPKDALIDYSAAISLSPDFAAALNNRAGIYTRLGLFAEARRDYLSALATSSPERRYSYFGLGQLAEMQGSLAEAGDFYGRALAVAPRFALAQERLALLSGNPQGAAPRSMAAEAAGSTGMASPPGQKQSPGLQTTPAPITGGGAASLSPEPASEGQVQLGAWRSQENAAKGWDNARTRAGTILEGAAPRIVAVDMPGAGRFYRLRVVVAQTGSRRFCRALVAKGLDCLPVRER
jgi:tetratricopeptide (TPR) repeat protein